MGCTEAPRQHGGLAHLTRLVLLDGFVFKVAEHDLEPIRIIGAQHPVCVCGREGDAVIDTDTI